MLTLFVFSTKDGWVKLMYNGIDAVGVDKQVICLLDFNIKLVLRLFSKRASLYFRCYLKTYVGTGQ